MRSRRGSVLGADWGPLAGVRKKSRGGPWRNWWTRTRSSPGCNRRASGLGTGEPLDEESAEGFVLPVGGVGGFEEDPGEVR